MSTCIVNGNKQYMRYFPRYVYIMEHLGYSMACEPLIEENVNTKWIFYAFSMTKNDIFINTTHFKVLKRDFFIVGFWISSYMGEFVIIKSYNLIKTVFWKKNKDTFQLYSVIAIRNMIQRIKFWRYVMIGE